MAYLLITLEGQAPARRPLDGPTIVGRAIDCAVWINDSRLSRQHCRFEPSGDEGWTVIDLSSKNGTIIRGERVSTHKLVDGDEIIVGRARVVFHSRSEPPQRPSAPAIASGPTARPSMSSADTLADSKFPVPKINPELDTSKSERQKAKAQRQLPLPFQRPRPSPKVHDAAGLLERVTRWFRRLRAR